MNSTMQKSSSLAKRQTRLARPVDVVGLELGANLPQGAPAVRLRKEGKTTLLLAADFLKPPGEFPVTMHNIAEMESLTWRLPAPFRAPDAALVINTPQTYLQYSVTKEEGQNGRADGYRVVSCQANPELPIFSAGLPEYQAAWAVHLLPEGSRPTACSLQVWQTAQLNLFMASHNFRNSPGNAVVMFVEEAKTLIAAFLKGQLTLCQMNQTGHGSIIDAVCGEMHIQRDLAINVLEDNLIDPTPIAEPVLRPLTRQIAFAANYLAGRCKAKTEGIHVYGIKRAQNLWRTLFTANADLDLIFCDPLDGLQLNKRTSQISPELTTNSELFMPAIGAALAVLEDE